MPHLSALRRFRVFRLQYRASELSVSLKRGLTNGFAATTTPRSQRLMRFCPSQRLSACYLCGMMRSPAWVAVPFIEDTVLARWAQVAARSSNDSPERRLMLAGCDVDMVRIEDLVHVLHYSGSE